MPSPKKNCPTCSNLMHPRAEHCRKCKPFSEKHRANISAALKGRTHKYHSGSVRPDVARKIIDYWTPERREEARQRGLRQAENLAWRLSCGRPGSASPTWEGGRTKIQYGRGWTPAWKRLVWKRANGRCELCQCDKPRDTHHIDFGKSNHASDNLLVLCRSCHKKIHAAHLQALKQNRDLSSAFGVTTQ